MSGISQVQTQHQTFRNGTPDFCAENIKLWIRIVKLWSQTPKLWSETRKLFKQFVKLLETIVKLSSQTLVTAVGFTQQTYETQKSLGSRSKFERKVWQLFPKVWEPEIKVWESEIKLWESEIKVWQFWFKVWCFLRKSLGFPRRKVWCLSLNLKDDCSFYFGSTLQYVNRQYSGPLMIRSIAENCGGDSSNRGRSHCA